MGVALLSLACSDTGVDGDGAGGAGAAAGQGGESAGGQSGAAGKGGAGQSQGGAGQAGTGEAGEAGEAGQGGSDAGAAGDAGQGGEGGAGQAGTSAGTAGKGGQPASDYCKGDDDCAGNLNKKVCDPTTNRCVGCLPGNDTCGKGTYCRVDVKVCTTGCKGDADCASNGSYCDPVGHACVQCVTDAQCADGSLCVKGSCAQGCSDTKPCADASQTCCGGTCHALATEVDFCGSCDNACPKDVNAAVSCVDSKCVQGACAQGFADCNGDPSDGCEVNTAEQGECVCTPGETKPCYEGPAGTKDVGTCKSGVQVCAPSGLGFIPGCTGQVLPQPEQCGDGLDHDCNGKANDVPDVDGDGWTACQGDCCEYTYQCGDPKLVNPGAYDAPGDQIDDDCNGVVGPLDCSQPVKFSNLSPNELAAAMELCQTTTESPADIKDKKWGVISAELLLANGSVPSTSVLNTMRNNQVAALANFGVNGPRKGGTMLGMSSGMMRDSGDSGYDDSDTSFGNKSTPPAAYLAAHSNKLPSSQGCSGSCPAGSGANDSVMLRLKVRVPTNAKSFSYDFRFFSYEYYDYQCTSYNDFFLALMTSGAAGIPADKNISFDSKNNPVSVNNGFFEVCSKSGGVGCNLCPAGTGDLSGTGMEGVGGATKWLTTVAPVVPGEIMTLDLMVFDVSDNALDSLSLIDNFQWLATPSSGPSTEPAK